MKFDEVRIILHELQKNPDLFEIKIKNYSIWNIIKIHLHNNITIKLNSGNDVTLLSSFNNKEILLRGIINCFLAKIEWLYFKTFKKDKYYNCIYLNLIGSRRYLSVNGKYKEPFSGDIALSTERKFNVFVVERNKGIKRKKNIEGKVHIRENIVKCPSLINFLPNKKLDQEIDNSIEKLLNILKKDLKSHPDIYNLINNEISSNVMKYKLKNFFNEKCVATKIVKTINPKLIIITSSDGFYGLMAAAKENNIPVIEFQHGVMDNYHPLYDWPEYLKNRKNELLVPDKIFLFGQYWKENMLSTNFWKDNELLCIGNARISEISNKYYKNINNIKKNYKTAKFVYTPTSFVRDESILFLNNALQIATENNIFLEIFIKVHPSEDSDYSFYFELEKQYPDKCKVFYHSQKSLYDCFVESDVHLSVYSASIFESLNIGKPTGILNVTGKEYFNDLIEKKYLKLIMSSKDLVDCAVGIINSSEQWVTWAEDTKKSSTYFYSNYSLHDIVQHLNKLVN